MAVSRGNPWFSAVEQTLPEYVPIPFNELMQAGQAIQTRYDTSLDAMDTTSQGLASIEARLPAHQQYVADYANKYRQEATDLLDRYNGDAADPQFTREIKRLNAKYTNDPNLRTVLMANESAKRNAEIGAKLAAEGQLYIDPQARGIDDQGRLINDVGQIRRVTTLDDMAERLKIAAGSQTEYGDLIGNRPALEQAQKEILESVKANAPEIQDLRQAYITRGLSPQEADNQIVQDLQRISGQYAVEEGTNWQKKNFQMRAAELAARRQQESAQKNIKDAAAGSGTYFVPTVSVTDDGGALVPEKVSVGNVSMPIAGTMNVENLNTEFSGKISGDITTIGTRGFIRGDKNKRNPSKTVRIKDGTFDSVQVPYTIQTVVDNNGNPVEEYQDRIGSIVSEDESWNLLWGTGVGTTKNSTIRLENGRPYIQIDEDTKAYVQPQAYAVYYDNDSEETYYKKLNRDETLSFLGPEAGRLSNSSEYSPGAYSRSDSRIKGIVTQQLRSQGINTPTNRQLDEYAIAIRDQIYYNEKIAPNSGKPGTRTTQEDLRYGQGN